MYLKYYILRRLSAVVLNTSPVLYKGRRTVPVSCSWAQYWLKVPESILGSCDELIDAHSEVDCQLAVMKQQMWCMSNNITYLSKRCTIVRWVHIATDHHTLVAGPTAVANHALGLEGD